MGEVNQLEKAAKHVWSLMQKARGGDDLALNVLMNISMCPTLPMALRKVAYPGPMRVTNTVIQLKDYRNEEPTGDRKADLLSIQHQGVVVEAEKPERGYRPERGEASCPTAAQWADRRADRGQGIQGPTA